MTLFRDIANSEQQKVIIDHVNQRWGQLYNLVKQWGEDSLNKLFFGNSGGAVAILGFVGTLKFENIPCSAKISLICFTIGAVIVILTGALLYHFMNSLFLLYRKDVTSFFNNSLSLEDLNKRDEDRSPLPFYIPLLGWVSFLFLVLGLIFGGICFFAKLV